MVVTYFHPELGVVVVNPKNRAHWDGVRILKRNELVTVFAGAFGETDGDKKYETAISLLIALIEGGKAKTPPALHEGQVRVQEAGPSAPPAPAPARGRAGSPRHAADVRALAAAEAAPSSAAAAPGVRAGLRRGITAAAAAAPAPAAAPLPRHPPARPRR